MAKARQTEAVAYLRVSSKGQEQGDGFDRQRDAIQRHAKRAGLKLVGEFAEAITGTEADRPEFSRMIEELLSNGCRTIVVESMDRFARELSVQVQLLAYLKSKGIALVSAITGETVTDFEDDPMREAMVQMQGVFAQLEKRLLVRKLAKARDRKRQQTGRPVGGVAPYGEKPGEAETLRELKRLRRKLPKTGRRRSYAAVALVLNDQGRTTRNGKPWTAEAVRNLCRPENRKNGPRLNPKIGKPTG